MKVAFIAGLSNKKIIQKLLPLQFLEIVDEIHLYRRHPIFGEKIIWIKIPMFAQKIPILGDLFRFIKLLVNAQQYDVFIGCHQRFHGIYAAIAGKMANKPVIQMIINDPLWIANGWLGKWTLRQASALAYRGKTTLRKYDNKYANQISFYIYNVWQPLNGFLTNKKTIDILYVGNHSKYKNIPGWIGVVAKVKSQYGKISAVMAGDKPNRHTISLIRKLGLKNDILFAGYLRGKTLTQYYSKAKVLLLTSFYEGLPMVALEAMIQGVPVVATKVGDMEDLIVNGTNGYLTEVNNIDQAAMAVVKLLTDKNCYREMSMSAIKSAEDILSKSTSEHVSEKWRGAFIKLGLVRQ